MASESSKSARFNSTGVTAIRTLVIVVEYCVYTLFGTVALVVTGVTLGGLVKR